MEHVPGERGRQPAAHILCLRASADQRTMGKNEGL